MAIRPLRLEGASQLVGRISVSAIRQIRTESEILFRRLPRAEVFVRHQQQL